MGVRKAVETATSALEGRDGPGEICTLGPLIHNAVVLDALAARGVRVLGEGDCSVDNHATVIIRAHGTTPDVLRSLKAQGARVVDATCPRVRVSQRRAAEWGAKGALVIIAGDRNHGEVASISGFARDAGGEPVVVQSAAEAETLALREPAVLTEIFTGETVRAPEGIAEFSMDAFFVFST